MSQVNVNLSTNLESDLENGILQMARSAFETVKQESTYNRFMRIDEACKFMNCSRGTIMNKYVPAGLKTIMIEKLMYIDQKDAIEFYQKHKK